MRHTGILLLGRRYACHRDNRVVPLVQIEPHPDPGAGGARRLDFRYTYIAHTHRPSAHRTYHVCDERIEPAEYNSRGLDGCFSSPERSRCDCRNASSLSRAVV